MMGVIKKGGEGGEQRMDTYEETKQLKWYSDNILGLKR